MVRRTLQKAIALLARVAADPADDNNTRLQKTLMLGGSCMFIAAGAIWGLLYIGLGEPAAGMIPLGYVIVSSVSMALFAVTRNYGAWRTSQLVLILLLPWMLMIALGGFINSSAVIIWSLLCPMGALIFDKPHRAPRWFLAYAALIILSGVLQPYNRADNHLSQNIIILFFVMNLSAISAIIFVLLYYFVGPKSEFQEKADQLLLNILPPEVAAILKDENRTIADHYDGVSVLFADVVDFTPLSAQMTAVEVVELLNDVFSYFDTLVEKYDVEKIKTIGDSYMVAAGVPRPCPDHAHSLARMALEIQAYVRDHEIRGQRLTFRIGINSGPVVAGVIGRKKFIFDLWGDAVNTASRMESHGASGAIQITRATYELIRGDFRCEPRGTVKVKGKGDMEVWNVVGENRPIPRVSAKSEHSQR